MSRKLRYKSIRKECIWRQHTLHAAYSVSSAKQSINKVATVIIDEIVDQIKHFADPKHLERIITTVRRIVKIAAETWRYARLERELITARLPAAEDSEEPVCEWTDNDEQKPRATGLPSNEGQPRRVLLRLLPIICREPTHEELRDGSKINDKGSTYSHGVALFSDSPAIVARVAELHRGLDQTFPPEMSGAVQQQHSSTEFSSVVPPMQSTGTISTPTRPISPRPTAQGDAREKKVAQPIYGEDNAQPEAMVKPQKEIIHPQRKRSQDSTHTSRGRLTGGESERSHSGSSHDTFSDRQSSDTKNEKHETIPNWGSSGRNLPGGW